MGLIMTYRNGRLDCMNATSNSTSSIILEPKFQIHFVQLHQFYDQVNLVGLIIIHNDGRLGCRFNYYS